MMPHVQARCNVITCDITIYGAVEFSTSDETPVNYMGPSQCSFKYTVHPLSAFRITIIL